MAKKPKAAPIPVTTEVIGKAAQTHSIKALVALADAYNRVAIYGPFATEMPVFVSAFIGGNKNQYRKFNVAVGKQFEPGIISIGKKQGLIFSFKPVESMIRDGEPVERIEMMWDDIINHFGDLSDKIEERLNRLREEPIMVEAINAQLKKAITKNPSMHNILTKGFLVAQTHAKQNATDDRLEEIPGFGMF